MPSGPARGFGEGKHVETPVTELSRTLGDLNACVSQKLLTYAPDAEVVIFHISVSSGGWFIYCNL
jgi:hypothetical protein